MFIWGLILLVGFFVSFKVGRGGSMTVAVLGLTISWFMESPWGLIIFAIIFLWSGIGSVVDFITGDYDSARKQRFDNRVQSEVNFQEAVDREIARREAVREEADSSNKEPSRV